MLRDRTQPAHRRLREPGRLLGSARLERLTPLESNSAVPECQTGGLVPTDGDPCASDVRAEGPAAHLTRGPLALRLNYLAPLVPPLARDVSGLGNSPFLRAPSSFGCPRRPNPPPRRGQGIHLFVGAGWRAVWLHTGRTDYSAAMRVGRPSRTRAQQGRRDPPTTGTLRQSAKNFASGVDGRLTRD
jgi:hypothetical protein